MSIYIIPNVRDNFIAISSLPETTERIGLLPKRKRTCYASADTLTPQNKVQFPMLTRWLNASVRGNVIRIVFLISILCSQY